MISSTLRSASIRQPSDRARAFALVLPNEITEREARVASRQTNRVSSVERRASRQNLARVCGERRESIGILEILEQSPFGINSNEGVRLKNRTYATRRYETLTRRRESLEREREPDGEINEPYFVTAALRPCHVAFPSRAALILLFIVPAALLKACKPAPRCNKCRVTGRRDGR